MPKISVIVPVYNTEKYLHRCVDSILAQTFSDFELLLINDGSKDKSATICDEYAQKDSRVRVFHKENGGASSARNLGLDNAVGEWITFVDSDDWIDTNYLIQLYKFETKSDLYLSGYTPHLIDIKDATYKNKEEIKSILNKHIFYFSNVCGKLFRSDIINQNKIMFDKNINYAEDTVFVFSYLQHIKSIHTNASFGYYYENSDYSLSKQIRTPKQGNYIFTNLCNKLLNLKDIFNIEIDIYCAYAGENIFRSVIEGVRKCDNILITKKSLQEMCDNKYVIQYFFDNEHILKGRKRKLFNFLAKNKMYTLLCIYIILYRGQIY